MRISDWSSDVCSSDLADLLGERATLLGIAGCDDRITLRQVPLGAILVGRHAVISCEMAPQHLHLLSVFEADDVIGLHRRPDRHRRLLLDFGFVCFVKSVQRRSEEHTSELQSLMRISYAVFCFTKKNSKI